MRCLVLGGAGFIGSHVVDCLLDAGHEVYVMSRQSNPHWVPRPEAKCTWTDWRDVKQLESLVAQVEVVIHLIGTTTPSSSNLDMTGDVIDNLVGTLNLLNLCRRHGTRKVVFASSGGTVYGMPEQIPIPESCPTHPINSYGITKLAIEKYLHLFHSLYGLGYVVIRASNAFGERQNLARPQGAVGIFMNLLLKSRSIEVWGDGQTVRDYVYVGDLASAFKLAAESPLTHGVFNAGSGNGVSLLGMLDELEAVTGLTPSVIHQPPRAFDVPTNILDIRLIKSALGWEPSTPLREGLIQTWKWLRELP